MACYHPLDEKTTIEYVTNCPQVRSKFAPDATLRCKEIGDGNLNLVFIISNADVPGESVVLKQSLPYLRCAGTGWPLDRKRVLFESKALDIQGQICPGHVPELYRFDEAMCLIVMQNLSNHCIMRKGLIEGITYPHFAEHMATFLAHTLFKTSDLFMASHRKKASVEFFAQNTELCKITEDFVFTNPFMESQDNRWNACIDAQVQALRADTRLKVEIAALKDGFLTRTQALIHGDLHTGSIMLNDQDTYVIDPEFAFYGPMGFDIGALLGNLVLSYCAHEIHSRDEDTRAHYQEWLLGTIREIWTGFDQQFTELWRTQNSGEATRPEFFAQCGGENALNLYRRRYIRRLLRDTLGYAGCKMIRRQVGIAHVEDIECIEDPAARAVAESLALSMGRRFILERYAVETIEDMLDIIKTTPVEHPLSSN